MNKMQKKINNSTKELFNNEKKIYGKHIASYYTIRKFVRRIIKMGSM